MKLTVKSSTESKNGGYVVTFKGESTTTVSKTFGVARTVTQTFCMKFDEPIPEGHEFDINMEEFEQMEYEGSTVKWLIEKQ